MVEHATKVSKLTRFKDNFRNSPIGQLFSYMGHAVIVSIAYMDPGNYGTDIQGGAAYNYNLLWIVWLASGMAMLLQYLSGKLGIATGRSLPEIMREKLKKKFFIIPYWLASEAASSATDLAEYLGTVIALKLVIWCANDLYFNSWNTRCHPDIDTYNTQIPNNRTDVYVICFHYRNWLLVRDILVKTRSYFNCISFICADI